MLTDLQKKQIDILMTDKGGIKERLLNENAISAYQKYPSNYTYILRCEVRGKESEIREYCIEKKYIQDRGNKRLGTKESSNNKGSRIVTNAWSKNEGDYYKFIELEIMNSEGKTYLERFLISNEILNKLK